MIYDLETTGLDRLKHRIVAVGCTINGEIKVFMDESEKVLLKDFWCFVDEVEPKRFVGFNNHTFDDPFVFHRTVSTDLDCGFHLFGYNNSVDLRVILTEFKPRSYVHKKGTLLDFCRLYKIPIPEDEHMGSDIPTLWEARKRNPENIEKIRLHCERDVQRTYELYSKMRRFL